ncbi:tyrosine-type recombinase/integrase [Kutzneria sp. NPDC052558]|uniref:tyrosine-type recombinase/integrase n=1 Tax=Kutzneria sp. NPDC052558 TaxID=3364121 RepID=UPI0037CA9012
MIRRNLWIDPRDAETLFEDFAEEWLDAISTRLTPATKAKYRSHLDTHLIKKWGAWPAIGIFNGYLEIEKWVSSLHENCSDQTVASIFATFSTIMKAMWKARMIPASPCTGIRVTNGEFETERFVSTPVQALRAAMRLYETSIGLTGFTLCLADHYTGARWSELVGQQRHEYDSDTKCIAIREPLKEVSGAVSKGGVIVRADVPPPAVGAARRSRGSKKGGRTKTPAGTRGVDLPPFLAAFYELLMDSHAYPFVFVSPDGAPLRRANFRQRFWRPVWDGVEPNNPRAERHRPPILPWFTFHEGRHSHSTWLAEDGVAEVARRARLGQTMRGMGRIYDHVTPEMRRQIIEALEARWRSSLAALRPEERARLASWFPHVRATIDALPRDAT